MIIKNYEGLSFMFEYFLILFRIFFIVFINREVCGVFSLQRGCDKEGGVGGKSAVLIFQHICDKERSFDVQRGGLTLEHGYDKESFILVQDKVNNVILTPKEKKVVTQ